MEVPISEPESPDLTSFTNVVPISVPLVFQSSDPWTPSSRI